MKTVRGVDADVREKDRVLQKIKGKLVVSCQALPHEPLHSSYIMSRMAVAAMEGGAAGILSKHRLILVLARR